MPGCSHLLSSPSHSTHFNPPPTRRSSTTTRAARSTCGRPRVARTTACCCGHHLRHADRRHQCGDADHPRRRPRRRLRRSCSCTGMVRRRRPRTAPSSFPTASRWRGGCHVAVDRHALVGAHLVPDPHARGGHALGPAGPRPAARARRAAGAARESTRRASPTSATTSARYAARSPPAVDPRVTHFVFMAGTAIVQRLVPLRPEARGEAREKFIAELAPLDPVRWVPKLRGPVLMQFADNDEHVSTARREQLRRRRTEGRRRPRLQGRPRVERGIHARTARVAEQDAAA